MDDRSQSEAKALELKVEAWAWKAEGRPNEGED